MREVIREVVKLYNSEGSKDCSKIQQNYAISVKSL